MHVLCQKMEGFFLLQAVFFPHMQQILISNSYNEAAKILLTKGQP